MQKFSRNIPLLYIYSVFIKRVSMPIIVLYFLLNNLNFTQIGILAAIMAATTFATEIHGGIFADKYGKKISLVLAAAFSAATMFFYFIGDSFFWFALASIMYGLSGAFISGTRNALLYDTLKKIKKTSDFKKYNGRMLLYSHVFNALVLLAIPPIYQVDPKLPFLIGIFFFLAAFTVGSFLIEPYRRQTRNDHLKASFREIRKNITLYKTIVLAGVISASVFAASEYIQPLLLISGLPIIYFGVVFALMRVIMGVSASIVHKLEKLFSDKHLLVVGVLVLISSLIGFSVATGVLIILSIITLKFSEGFNRIILEDDLNKQATSGNRTTILSINSLLSKVLVTVLAVLLGSLADRIGIQATFLVFTPVFAIVSLLIIRWRSSHKIIT